MLDYHYLTPCSSQFCISAPSFRYIGHLTFQYTPLLLYKHVFPATTLSIPYLLVALFLATVVDAFAAWQPKCTTPTQHVNYVSSPQVRGTMDIIWTCFAVLSLCTWTVQHLMVPVQREHQKMSTLRKLRGKVSFNYTKLKWMGMCIVAPEYVLGKALNEYLAAHDSRRLFREWLAANYRGKDLKSKVAHDTEEPMEEVWTTAHGFFANMRGFVLRFDVAAVPTSLEPAKPTPLGRSRQNPRLVTRDGDPPYYHQEVKIAEAIELDYCREICGVPCQNRPDVLSTKHYKSPASPLPRDQSPYAESSSDTEQRGIMIRGMEESEEVAMDIKKGPEVLRLQTDGVPLQDYSPTEGTAVTLVNRPEFPQHDITTGLMPSMYALNPFTPGRMSVQQKVSPGSDWLRLSVPEKEKLGPHKTWKGSWALSSIQLLYACQKGIIPGPPELSTAELEDRSKGDIFVKGAAILQLTWLVIQMVVRGSEGLAVSLLEITTLAYAVCAIATYSLLWHKPQDVMVRKLRNYSSSKSNADSEVCADTHIH